MIEGRGIPTLVIGTAYDIMSRVTPPRAAFVDHPVGRTFGAPHQPDRRRTILARAFSELPKFTAAGQIRDLGCHWLPDGGWQWQAELRAELRHG